MMMDGSSLNPEVLNQVLTTPAGRVNGCKNRAVTFCHTRNQGKNAGSTVSAVDEEGIKIA